MTTKERLDLVSLENELLRCRADLENARSIALDLKRRIDQDDSRQRELDELKSNFIALVSHELRTPVAVLSGFLEVGLSEIAPSLSEGHREYLYAAARNAKRLSRIVQELTDFSRFQTSARVTGDSPLPVEAALEQVLLLLRPAFDTKRIRPEVSLAPEIGRLSFDGESLVIIFRNLLSNAAKFSPEGGRIWITGQSANGSAVIDFNDMASPIPPEKRDAIFEDFRQLENHLTRRYEGLGLGLALARRAARSLGGDIRLAVRGEDGNTFTVTVPMGASA